MGKKVTINKSFKQSMNELHTWGGLVFGWLLFAIFLTGTLAVFQPELTHWMNPEFRVNQVLPEEALAAADKRLRLTASRADSWNILLPQPRSPVLEVSWKKGSSTVEKHLDPLSGTVLKQRHTEGGHFFTEFHSELHSGKTGLWLVSIASLVMLAALLSGIAIRMQAFKEFFLLRWKRTWLHAHLMTGVFTLPFVLLITYTGLVLTLFEAMPVAKQLLYEKPAELWNEVGLISGPGRAHVPAPQLPLQQLLPLAEEQLGKGMIAFVQVKNPGDKQAVVTFIRRIDDRIAAVGDRASFDGTTGALLGTHTQWNPHVYAVRYLAGLHVARFGGYTISWLYFLAGLFSSVMIAAGLVFFTVKRRSRYNRSSTAGQHAYHIIEALNVTAIAGMTIACTAYLWANRILPVTMKERAAAEITIFFVIWLVTLLHAFWRSPLKAWVEQLRIAAGLCAALPLLNALTTQVGLFPAIQKKDWMTAGVDLTSLTLGILLTVTARQVAKQDLPDKHPGKIKDNLHFPYGK